MTRDIRKVRGTAATNMLAALVINASVFAQVMTAPDPPPANIIQKLNNQVPMDLTFTDESGQPVQLKDLAKGKPIVLALVYYECPMLCGEIMQGMLKVFNELPFTIGDEYVVVTVSFNPDEKSDLARIKKRNMLEHYKSPDAADGWHFLTSEEANVRALAESVGFQYSYLPSVGEYAHASGIMVLTPEGKVSRYFYGIEYPERDLRFGLIEAANERIGSIADEVLLLCYRYDPASGSYGFVIMAALRIAGATTVVGLALLVGLFLWQERRARARADRDGNDKHPVLTH